ncbi:MAG: hypothetical protein LBG44_03145, partial [Gemmatimonadota bacterium]|nr:hypothetical protein [Gemmatimonadota bacterium]
MIIKLFDTVIGMPVPQPPRKMRRCRNSSITLLMLVCLAVLITNPPDAQAQYTVPDGGTFAGGGVPAAPAAGSTIELIGNATLSANITAPAGLVGLTINGATGGSTITISNRFRFLNGGVGQPQTWTFGGGPITFAGDGGVQPALYGGVFSSNGSPLTINGDLTAINNRTKTDGGVIYASSVTATGSITLRNNGAGVDSVGSFFGGGIFANLNVVLGTDDGKNVIMTGNTAARTGGAISSNAGAVTIGNSTGIVTFNDNQAFTGNGGAIYAGSITNSLVDITGKTISFNNNFARDFGGAIYAADIKLTGEVTANGNSTSPDNNAGGAFYAAGTNGGITINGTLVANNNRSGFGAALVANGTGGILVTGATEITGNVASRAATAGNGGAINIGNGGVGTVRLGTVSGDVVLSRNIATGSGGGVFKNNGRTAEATMVFGNTSGTTKIEGNLAGYDSLRVAIGNETNNGGAIYSSAPIQLNGTTVTLSNNRAVGSGGATYGGAVTVDGVFIVDGNMARLGAGGAIFSGGSVPASGGLTARSSVSFTNNIAGGGAGGAVSTSVTDSILLATNPGSTATMTGNRSASHGGFLAASGTGSGVLTIGNTSGATTFRNNLAGYDSLGVETANIAAGGAIYYSPNTGGLLTINGSLITLSQNRATGAGGGIYSPAAGGLVIHGPLVADSN